jgi:hypothetical protein
MKGFFDLDKLDLNILGTPGQQENNRSRQSSASSYKDSQDKSESRRSRGIPQNISVRHREIEEES